MSLDGLCTAILVALSIAQINLTAPKNLGKLLVTRAVKLVAG